MEADFVTMIYFDIYLLTRIFDHSRFSEMRDNSFKLLNLLMDLELDQEYALLYLSCILHCRFIFNKAFNSFQLLFRIVDANEGSPIVNIKKIKSLLGNDFIEGISMSEHPEDCLPCFALHICTFKSLADELQLENSLENYSSLYNHHPLVRLINAERKINN